MAGGPSWFLWASMQRKRSWILYQQTTGSSKTMTWTAC
uniref:Uncharacterized protein n=1 Tax=Anguilla anguilla TaxID=7936 RepID=A0A0E9RR60_ANGAN